MLSHFRHDHCRKVRRLPARLALMLKKSLAETRVFDQLGMKIHESSWFKILNFNLSAGQVFPVHSHDTGGAAFHPGTGGMRGIARQGRPVHPGPTRRSGGVFRRGSGGCRGGGQSGLGQGLFVGQAGGGVEAGKEDGGGHPGVPLKDHLIQGAGPGDNGPGQEPGEHTGRRSRQRRSVCMGSLIGQEGMLPHYTQDSRTGQKKGRAVGPVRKSAGRGGPFSSRRWCSGRRSRAPCPCWRTPCGPWRRGDAGSSPRRPCRG